MKQWSGKTEEGVSVGGGEEGGGACVVVVLLFSSFFFSSFFRFCEESRDLGSRDGYLV